MPRSVTGSGASCAPTSITGSRGCLVIGRTCAGARGRSHTRARAHGRPCWRLAQEARGGAPQRQGRVGERAESEHGAEHWRPGGHRFRAQPTCQTSLLMPWQGTEWRRRRFVGRSQRRRGEERARGGHKNGRAPTEANWGLDVICRSWCRRASWHSWSGAGPPQQVGGAPLEHHSGQAVGMDLRPHTG